MSDAKHILVVDDEEDVRDTLSSVLESLNYIPYTAASGAEALKILQDKNIDVVLSDLYMPEMDGIQLLKKVRAFDSKLIFMMITAHPTIETAVDAIKGCI